MTSVAEEFLHPRSSLFHLPPRTFAHGHLRTALPETNPTTCNEISRRLTMAKSGVAQLERRESLASATTTDLSRDAVAEISNALRELLADVFALYLKTKNFHWHIS